jgi:hypothetical protein
MRSAGPAGRRPRRWFYILKEGEVLRDGNRLGPVGGRTVGDVLVGIIDGYPESFRARDHELAVRGGARNPRTVPGTAAKWRTPTGGRIRHRAPRGRRRHDDPEPVDDAARYAAEEGVRVVTGDRVRDELPRVVLDATEGTPRPVL